MYSKLCIYVLPLQTLLLTAPSNDCRLLHLFLSVCIYLLQSFLSTCIYLLQSFLSVCLYLLQSFLSVGFLSVAIISFCCSRFFLWCLPAVIVFPWVFSICRIHFILLQSFLSVVPTCCNCFFVGFLFIAVISFCFSRFFLWCLPAAVASFCGFSIYCNYFVLLQLFFCVWCLQQALSLCAP